MTVSSSSTPEDAGASVNEGHAETKPRERADTASSSSHCAKRVEKEGVAMALAILGGVAIVTQNGVNTNLKQNAVSAAIPAASVNFAVGFLCVSCAALVHKPRWGEASFKKAPWYAYIGGLLGPLYVITGIVLSSRLGFAVYQLCSIGGQLASGLLCDAVGLWGLPQRKPTPIRIAAVMCLVIGVVISTSGMDFGDEPLGWVAVYCAATFVCSGAAPVQACANATMSKHLKSPFRAGVISFGGGLLFLLVISGVSVASGLETLELSGGPAWMWMGGGLGMTYVSSAIIGSPRIGTAAYFTVSLGAQLATAMIYDAVGFLGFAKVALSPHRVFGIFLAFVAGAAFQARPGCLGGWLGKTKGVKSTPECPEVEAQS